MTGESSSRHLLRLSLKTVRGVCGAAPTTKGKIVGPARVLGRSIQRPQSGVSRRRRFGAVDASLPRSTSRRDLRVKKPRKSGRRGRATASLSPSPKGPGRPATHVTGTGFQWGRTSTSESTRPSLRSLVTQTEVRAAGGLDAKRAEAKRTPLKPLPSASQGWQSVGDRRTTGG